MGREKDLFTINDRFIEYYSFVKEEFEKFKSTLKGVKHESNNADVRKQ